MEQDERFDTCGFFIDDDMKPQKEAALFRDRHIGET